MTVGRQLLIGARYIGFEDTYDYVSESDGDVLTSSGTKVLSVSISIVKVAGAEKCGSYADVAGLNIGTAA